MTDFDAFDPTPSSDVDNYVAEVIDRAREMAASHVEEARRKGLPVHPEDDGWERVVMGETRRILATISAALTRVVDDITAEANRRWPRPTT
jgi:hypothetical protein